MENVTLRKDIDEVTGTILETVLIDLGDGNFISMLKSVYDEQQKALKDAAKQRFSSSKSRDWLCRGQEQR